MAHKWPMLKLMGYNFPRWNTGGTKMDTLLGVSKGSQFRRSVHGLK